MRNCTKWGKSLICKAEQPVGQTLLKDRHASETTGNSCPQTLDEGHAVPEHIADCEVAVRALRLECLQNILASDNTLFSLSINQLITRHTHPNFTWCPQTACFVRPMVRNKPKIFNLLLNKAKKAANPHNREAGTRQCFAFLLK